MKIKVGLNNLLKTGKGLLVLSIFVISGFASAQTVLINGTVLDEYGVPLPGAAVIEQGTSNGTATDFNGNYSIEVNTGSTLVFSYIGYINQSIKVAGQNEINVTMEPDISSLDEVVVVGYGTQKKESVVGAIAQIDGNVLTQRGTIPSVTDALSGQIPGVTVLSSTGIPGGAPNGNYGENSAILIRGRSTFNAADSAPLVLVDGVERDFNDIDPNDIENISVLKDASATAVFGVKGGNGVILITTKRGRFGAPTFKVDANYTIKKISRIPKVLDGYTSTLAKNRAIINELATNPQSWSDYTTPDELGYIQSQEFPDAYPNIDWQDVMLNDFAQSYKVNLSVSGGTDFVKYYGGLGYLRDGDIFATEDLGQGYDPDFKYDRINFRSNLDFNLTKSTKLSVNLAGYYGKRQIPGANQFDFWFGVYSKPWTHPVLQYEDGVYGQGILFERLGQNEYVDLNYSGYIVDNRAEINTGIKLEQELDFITPGLTFLGEFAYDNYGQTRGKSVIDDGILTKYVDPAYYFLDDPNANIEDYTNYFEPTVDTDGFEFTENPLFYENEIINGNAANATRINILARLTLRYNRSFGDHNVGALALFSRESQKNYSFSGFPLKREDFSGRVSYTYKNRYNVELSGSYNGSDAFGPLYRYDFFPAIGLGWTLSNESFFEVFKPLISNVKFRYSDGVVGNDRVQGIGQFPYLTRFAIGGAGGGYDDFNVFGDNSPIPGPTFIREALIGNPNLRWESARKQNYGVDLGFFDNRLNLTMDMFKEKREDILIPSEDRQVPDFFGAPPPTANLGIVTNQGYEFIASYQDNIGEFNYNVTFQATYVKDEVIYREDPELTPDYQKQAGFQIGQNRGILTDGLAASWDDIYTNVVGQNTSTYLPGDYILIDYNADGVIDADDAVAFGYPNRPQRTYNFLLGASWKGFSLNANFYGQYNVTQTVNLNEFAFNAAVIYPEHLNATFTPEYGNTNPTFRNLRYARQNVSNGNFYQRDGSFLRLKTAELSYSIPKTVIERIGLTSLRIFVNGNNLFLWSDLPVDIEGSNFDVRNYPVTKQYNFGFTATF